MSRTLPWLLAVVVIATSLPAATAAEPEDRTRRIAWIEKQLNDEQESAKLWWDLWLAGYATLAGLNAVAAGVVPELLDASVSDKEREQWRGRFLVTMGASTLGTIAGLARPWWAKCGTAPLRSYAPGSKDRLRAAETLLEEAAEQQEFGRSWLTHLGAAAINIGAGLVLWLGYDLPVDAAITAVAGMAIAELQIWTQPTGLMEAQARYKSGAWRTAAGPARQPLRWTVAPMPGGASVGLIF